MKTIVNKNTGQVLYTSNFEPTLEIEIGIDEMLTVPLIKPFFNFTTRAFYEGALEEEINQIHNSVQCPSEVSLWKIRAILKIMQLEDLVTNALNNLEEPTKTAALYIWSYGTAIDRDSQTVAYIQNVLQLTNDQVDDIFIQANSLKL